MLKKIFSGIMAGILVSIGGCVFLGCDNRYVGAVIFSVALICICYKGYSLFTGRIGFVIGCSKEDVSALLLGLLGNAIGTAVCGYAAAFASAAAKTAALGLCTSKLTQTIPQTFIKAVFCGILMYMAVSIFKENKTPVGIIFCIPVFILSGFEHSIADMFYFAASGIVSFEAFIYIFTVILGNAAGALIFPALSIKGKENKQ